MRIKVTETEIVVDLVRSVVDLGQLGAMATKLGLTAVIEPTPDQEVDPGYRVRFFNPSGADYWGRTALANLAILYAYASGISGSAVLDHLKHDLEARHFPLDKPIQDVLGIGEGPNHAGHDDA